MNAAGIDVSKGKSMVSVMRPFGEVVAKPFTVRHTGSELKELADYLKSLDGETRIIMAHTGRYYEPVAQFLHDAGLYVSAVNPKLIKDYGNNSLRKVKTDKADSRKIAKYGLDNWVELRQYVSMDKIRYQLKTLNRQCNLYGKTKTMMKNNLIALLDQTYPGVNDLFDSPVREDGTQKWVDFAASFWHLECVKNVSLDAFTGRYRKWCKRNKYNFSSDKAAEIYAGVQDQIAMLPKDALTKLMIRQAINALNAVSATLEKLMVLWKTLVNSWILALIFLRPLPPLVPRFSGACFSAAFCSSHGDAAHSIFVHVLFHGRSFRHRRFLWPRHPLFARPLPHR